MNKFAIIRLGKDSVADIKALDSLTASPLQPISFTVTCAQVPPDLTAGDFAFFCLGSDNNKGIQTTWTRGVRALGTILRKSGGPGYNDPWNVDVEVKVVLPKSLTQKELLAKAPVAYYWCSDIPVLGVDTHSNQTIQLIKTTEPNQSVSSFVFAINSIHCGFKSDVLQNYPVLGELFNYAPTSPMNDGGNKEKEDLFRSQTSLNQDLISRFISDSAKNNLKISSLAATRIAAALLSKRFLIATGLSGSGKTKIAQAFARWITADPGWCDDADHSKGKKPNPYYSLVPVGADWTGNDNVLGYPDGIRDKTYNSKPTLDLILHAAKNENKDKPHFLILDEMNLSHVERYFSDILSAIESDEPIPLHNGVDLKSGEKLVPTALVLPPNLFIIGTVNVDETTYMFSPKVLDRANVIEFRMDGTDLGNFLEEPKAVLLDELDGKGEPFGKLFATAAADKTRSVPDEVKSNFKQEMILFFNILQQHHSEFGYRTSYESARFIHFYKELSDPTSIPTDLFDSAMDAVIVQKLLPKLHGSRSKLEGLLWALIYACATKRSGELTAFTEKCLEAGEAENDDLAPRVFDKEFEKQERSERPDVPYPLSFNKLMRMYRKLVRDQFVTFSEA